MFKALRFLGWPLLVGLLLALLLMQRYPQWVGLPSNDVHLRQAPQYGAAREGPVSYADAVSLAAPAVANLYTTKVVNKSNNPLFDDPMFRRFFGDNLPKTRSGKIMRRLLRSIAKGEAITQDTSTLENPAILEQLAKTN